MSVSAYVTCPGCGQDNHVSGLPVNQSGHIDEISFRCDGCGKEITAEATIHAYFEEDL
jgi:transposase-like protein